MIEHLDDLFFMFFDGIEKFFALKIENLNLFPTMEVMNLLVIEITHPELQPGLIEKLYKCLKVCQGLITKISNNIHS